MPGIQRILGPASNPALVLQPPCSRFFPTSRFTTMSTGISSPSNLPVGPIQASEPTLAEQHVEKQAILDALVNRVVDETVFPKKQFIVLEKEMDATSKLAITCLQALRMERSRWDEVKGLVRKKLGTKRNNSLARVRRSLLRKWCANSKVPDISNQFIFVGD